MDDDNGYHPRLWPALRALGPRRVGALALRRGIYSASGAMQCHGLLNSAWQDVCMAVERPVYDPRDGKLLRFHASWCAWRGSWLVRTRGARAFCLDMGAFAFDAALLQARRARSPLSPLHRRALISLHLTRAFPPPPRLARALAPPTAPRWSLAGRTKRNHLGLPRPRRRVGADRHAAPARRRARGVEELQPLANCARDVLVFHNEFRSTPRAILHPPVANCTADGWGRAAADPAREVRRRNLSVARRKERQRRRDVQDVCLHLAGSPQAFPVL